MYKTLPLLLCARLIRQLKSKIIPEVIQLMKNVKKSTELLYASDATGGVDHSPESLPIYQTTAFTSRSLDEVQERYKLVDSEGMYSYYRSSNPNRASVAHSMSFLEGGEASLTCSSGMAAICGTLMTLLDKGDHIVYSNCCYGETLEIMTERFEHWGIDVSAVNINNLDEVKKALRPDTKIIYTEVVANPLMRVADIDTLAEWAHERGGYLIVDNTFTTPFAIRPIEHGADIVINSMTKFLNGHSDACAGSITASEEMIKKLDPMIQHFGTPADPFTSWLVTRSLKTAELRIAKQMSNAAKLAKALEKNPHVVSVSHPCIESFPDHGTAVKLWGEGKDEEMCGMLSITVDSEDYDKRNEFVKSLQFVRYAPTLGGVRTTFQQPVFSSHAHMPDAERRAMGITPGMFRISVGIEDPDDLINEFNNALKAFD